jgi:autotransporter-associated beta strand protein
MANSSTFSQSGGTNSIGGDLQIDSGSSYNLSGGVLSAGQVIGSGSVIQTGGSNTCKGWMTVTSYSLSGSGSLSADTEKIGGVFTQVGATNTVSRLEIMANGTYTLDGGTLNLNEKYESSGILDLASSAATINAASATLFFTGGTLSNSQNATLNVDSHSLVVVNSGSGSAFAQSFANFNNAGILHEVGTILEIESTRSLSISDTISDHVKCDGTLAGGNLMGGLTAGPTSNVQVLYLYVNDSDSGMSGGSSVTSRYERIGASVAGRFTQSGGKKTVYELTLGHDKNVDGTYVLTSGVLTSDDETIGYMGTGTFIQDGGTHTVVYGNPGLCIGEVAGSVGTYVLNSGTLTAPYETVGYSGTGTFTQNGGTHTITGNYGLDFAESFGGQGTYNLNGGTLILRGGTSGSGRAAFNFGGGTLQASGNFGTGLNVTLTGVNGSATIDTAGYAVLFSRVLSGPGGLNKIGAGFLTLSGSNTYRGDTFIAAGTLKVSNTSGSATGSGAVTVAEGATLSGSGRVDGPVLVAGNLMLGDGPGILTVNNQVTLAASSTFFADINGLSAGTSYDQLRTTGSVSLAGSLALSFGNFSPSGQDVLFLINNTGTGTTTGTFQYEDNSKIGNFNGFDWYITYDANNTSTPALDGGNDVAIYTVVPEPGGLFLIVSALLAGLFLARTRKAERR